MAPSRTRKTPMQIDGQLLRRSSRIAQLQETQKNQVSIDIPTVNKSPQKKSAPKKQRVIKQHLQSIKVDDYDSMKINDLFKLVNMHTLDQSNKKLYYNILQKIVKNVDKLSIRNRVKDMYEKRADVITFVCSTLNVSFDTVDDFLDTTLCYKEVKEAQLRKTVRSMETDLDFIIQSINKIKI